MSAIAPQLHEEAAHRPLADVAHQMQPVALGRLDRVGMTEIEIPVEVAYQACSETDCLRPKKETLALQVPIEPLVMPGRGGRI